MLTMGSKIFNIAIVLTVVLRTSNGRLGLNPEDLRRPFYQDLYRNVLDPVACQAQWRNISQGNPLLLLRFLDAGIRTPRGILEFNMVDLGNYNQCLEIDERLDENMRIQGKYCLIEVPTDQEIQFPLMKSRQKDSEYGIDAEIKRKMEYAQTRMYQERAVRDLVDIRTEAIGLPPIVFRLAVCIPKPCTPQDVLSNLAVNVTELGVTVTEEFCRLPNDKPWVAADTVAVVVFFLIGFLTLLSTCYDLYHTLLLKRDPKSANTICTAFSVYTNTNRFVTFKTTKGAMECLDGIRVLSMMWIIAGHSLTMHPIIQNVDYLYGEWLITPNALWLTTAPIAVDTFFLIAGVLLVYTTVGKMTGCQLLSKLHLFYLHRLLRLFPPLAALVLLEASVLHRISDGPIWSLVARNAQRCRTFWWTTLLHVQNQVNPLSMCVSHSWYIAIDVQLYIVSPVILFWVLSGNKKAAWSALVCGLLAILTASTVFIFIKELPGGMVAMNRWDERMYYMEYYYLNTLTRGAPFFIGMVFGYTLHLCRGTKVKIPLLLLPVLWGATLVALASPFYTSYIIKQPDWDNQTVDSLINSFQRSVWAAGIGWIIFACVHGYAGPINWLLSRPLWKLPSRLSYAMYLYHYSMMFVFGDRSQAPVYFSVTNTILDFLSMFSLALLVAFIVAIVIEAPFTTLFKLMFDTGAVKSKKATETDLEEKNDKTS